MSWENVSFGTSPVEPSRRVGRTRDPPQGGSSSRPAARSSIPVTNAQAALGKTIARRECSSNKEAGRPVRLLAASRGYRVIRLR